MKPPPWGVVHAGTGPAPRKVRRSSVNPVCARVPTASVCLQREGIVFGALLAHDVRPVRLTLRRATTPPARDAPPATGGGTPETGITFDDRDGPPPGDLSLAKRPPSPT